MLAIAVVIVWALVFGVSPGLALVAAAAGLFALERYDPGLAERLIGTA